MPNTEVRALQLSNLYYNQGLERAGVRDLSGAVTKLRQSLLLNKRNTPARNLLGLIYWETGEVAEALREWLLSQSYQPKNNPAADYVRRMQAERNDFQNRKDAIAAYNKALENCRDGHDDMAAVQLRRVLSRNPRMVRAAQLLALVDIREGKLGQARKVLRRIEKVDRANPLTLRYLKEIEDQAAARSRRRRDREIREEETEQEQASLAAAQRFRSLPSFSSLVNVLIGLTIGVLATGFLIVPAVRRSMHQEMNTRVQDYTTTLAEQKDRIDSLEAQIQESDAVVEKARTQVEASQSEVTSYDSLVKAYNYYIAKQYMMAAEELDKIDAAKLTTGSAAIYAGIHSDVMQNAYSEYVYAGNVAYAGEDWDEAIRCLEKAVSIRMEDSDPLQMLALAYEAKGNTQRAIEYYQKIIDTFPNTYAADNAAYAIRMMGGETDYTGSSGESTAYTDGTWDGYTDNTYGDGTGEVSQDTVQYDNVTPDGQSYTVQGYDGGAYSDQTEYVQDTGYEDTYGADTGYTDTAGYTEDTGYAADGTDAAWGTDAGGVLQEAYTGQG